MTGQLDSVWQALLALSADQRLWIGLAVTVIGMTSIMLLVNRVSRKADFIRGFESAVREHLIGNVHLTIDEAFNDFIAPFPPREKMWAMTLWTARRHSMAPDIEAHREALARAEAERKDAEARAEGERKAFMAAFHRQVCRASLMQDDWGCEAVSGWLVRNYDLWLTDEHRAMEGFITDELAKARYKVPLDTDGIHLPPYDVLQAVWKLHFPVAIEEAERQIALSREEEVAHQRFRDEMRSAVVTGISKQAFLASQQRSDGESLWASFWPTVSREAVATIIKEAERIAPMFMFPWGGLDKLLKEFPFWFEPMVRKVYARMLRAEANERMFDIILDRAEDGGEVLIGGFHSSDVATLREIWKADLLDVSNRVEQFEIEEERQIRLAAREWVQDDDPSLDYYLPDDSRARARWLAKWRKQSKAAIGDVRFNKKCELMERQIADMRGVRHEIAAAREDAWWRHDDLKRAVVNGFVNLRSEVGTLRVQDEADRRRRLAYVDEMESYMISEAGARDEFMREFHGRRAQIAMTKALLR